MQQNNCFALVLISMAFSVFMASKTFAQSDCLTKLDFRNSEESLSNKQMLSKLQKLTDCESHWYYKYIENRLLFSLGRHEIVMAKLDKLIETAAEPLGDFVAMKANNIVLLNKVHENSEYGNLDDALKLFGKALKLKHHNKATIYHGIAEVYLLLRNWDQATQFGRLILKISQHPRAFSILSIASANKGEYQNAIELIKIRKLKGKERDQNAFMAESDSLWAMVASLCQVGRKDVAKKMFEYAMDKYGVQHNPEKLNKDTYLIESRRIIASCSVPLDLSVKV